MKKKDGTNQVVIDYRGLKNITKKNSYFLPQNYDTINILYSSQFFSVVGLTSGHQEYNLSEGE